MTDLIDLIKRLRDFPGAVLDGMPLCEEAADAIEALVSSVESLEMIRLDLNIEARRLTMERDAALARVKRLEDALAAALEYDGGVSYTSEYDSIGDHACCASPRYKAHDPECWVLKAQAALKGDKP